MEEIPNSFLKHKKWPEFLPTIHGVGTLLFQPSFSIYRVLFGNTHHQINLFVQGDFHRLPTVVAYQNIVNYRGTAGVSYRFGARFGGFINAALGYSWLKITPKPLYFLSNAYNLQIGFWSAFSPH